MYTTHKFCDNAFGTVRLNAMIFIQLQGKMNTVRQMLAQITVLAVQLPCTEYIEHKNKRFVKSRNVGRSIDVALSSFQN